MEFAEAVAEVATVAMEDGLGFVVGKFAAGEFADEGVEEFAGSFQFEDDGEAAAAMDGDDEAGGVRGGGADGEPVARGELLGAIEEDEGGGFHFAEFVGEAFFFPHAALGLEAEDDGLKAACFEVWDELLEEGGFAGAVAADDAGAPLLGFDALEERLPICASGKVEGEAFEFGNGEWVVGHGARVSCGAVVWEEKVTTGGEVDFLLLLGADGFGFYFCIGGGGGDDGNFGGRGIFGDGICDGKGGCFYDWNGIGERGDFLGEVGDFTFFDDDGFGRCGCGFGFGGRGCFLGWRIEGGSRRCGGDRRGGLFEDVGFVVALFDEGYLQRDEELEFCVLKLRGVAQCAEAFVRILPMREAAFDFAAEERGVDVMAVAGFHRGECGGDFTEGTGEVALAEGVFFLHLPRCAQVAQADEVGRGFEKFLDLCEGKIRGILRGDHLVVGAEDEGFDLLGEWLGKFVEEHDEAALRALREGARLDDVADFPSVEAHPAWVR